MMENRIVAAMAVWRVKAFGNEHFVSGTTSYYINYLAHQFEKVYVISDYEQVHDRPENLTFIDANNVEFLPIRTFGGYLSGQKRFFEYYRVLKRLKNKVDWIYCRVPDNFSWLPAFMGFRTIMHFVGDTIDATWHNERWNALKKAIMIAGYYPDYMLTLRSARRSKVYVNGYHLVKRLEKYGIKAHPVISSTVSECDLPESIPELRKGDGIIRLIYIGYIRFAKGITTIMALLEELKRNGIKFHFDIVGDGEMLDELQSFVAKRGLFQDVTLHGRIDDRRTINTLLRASDLFIFPSLSEGSPRVVIEAMSQGVPVVSTPVGSVPYSFTDGESVRLFPFNDADAALNIIKEYMVDCTPFEAMRQQAFKIVKSKYTKEKFMSQIFQI